MRPTFLLIAVLAVALPPSARAEPGATRPNCSELPWRQWERAELLVVHEATTCSYVVTWTGWSPPRKYTFAPDGQGWISDYFISGAHGRVFWNLRTNAVVVRPLSQAMLIDEAGARGLASHARQTIFPGAHLSKFTFNPSPCPEQGACGPQ